MHGRCGKKKCGAVMKREEQIYNQATNYGYAVAGGSTMRPPVSKAFSEGAKWADNNPQQTEWIKFSDRLPEIGQRIIRFGGSEIRRLCTMFIIKVDEYFLMDVRDFPDEFVCWMPIPELPKEEKK